MPLYDLLDTLTDEVREVFLPYEKLKDLLKENPHLKQIISAPAVVSGVVGLTHKNDSGFGDLMSRIAEANPHSPLADTYGNKGIKETKTRAAVKKAKANA